MPDLEGFTGFLAIMTNRLTEKSINQTLSIEKHPLLAEVTRRAPDSVLHQLLRRNPLLTAMYQFQSMKARAQSALLLNRFVGKRPPA